MRPSTSNLAFGTVYHKLTFQCFPNTGSSAPGGAFSSSCRDAFGNQYSGRSSTSRTAPLFDLTTSTDIRKCNGTACAHAAAAVLSYQQLLGLVTPTRWDLLRASTGHSTSGDDVTTGYTVMTSPTMTWQRSCTAMRAIVQNAAKIHSQLPSVVAGLRSVAPHLDAPVRAERARN
jgi:hypothetical protein